MESNFQDYSSQRLAKNHPIPILESRGNHSLIIALPSSIKVTMMEFIRLALGMSLERETGEIPSDWTLLCEMRSPLKHHYAPRWTLPFFYFRENISAFLIGKNGLDIGARISTRDDLPKRGLGSRAPVNPLLIETLVPHFRYYSNLRCNMRAIDISAPDRDYEEIEFGDARLLSFAAESFDFVTLAMLLGPTNVCATYLEVALCLCELKRVLRGGGFAYIADAGFQPIVGFAAQCLDFEVFVSKGTLSGAPIGTILRKRIPKSRDSSFDEMFASSNFQRLTFDLRTDQFVTNCNLLFDTANVVCSETVLSE